MHWIRPRRKLPRSDKIVYIVAFVSIGILSLLSIPLETDGYESNIFSSIGVAGLALIISVIGLLFSLLIWKITSDSGKPSHVYLVLFVITLIQLPIQLLPLLRGYFFYGRGDMARIYGEISFISQTGHIRTGNIYPGFQLLAKSLSSISGMPQGTILLILPSLFTGLFVLFIVILGRITLVKRKEVLWAGAGATIFLLSYRYANALFDMQALSLLIIPVMFYTFMRARKRKSNAFGLLSVIFIIALPILHPLTTVLLVFTLLTILGIGFLGDILPTSQLIIPSKNNNVNSTFMLLIGLIIVLVSFLWFTYTNFFANITLKMIESISSLLVGQSSVDLQGANQLSLVNFLRTFILRLGHVIVFLFFTLVGILFLFREYLNNQRQVWKRFNLILTWFLIASAFQAAHLVSSVFPDLFVYRFVGPVAIFTPILAAKAFQTTIEYRTVLAIVLVFILTASAGIGVVSSHPSPYTNQPSYQITQSEFSATEWIIESGPEGAQVKSISSRPFRFATIIMGIEDRLRSPLFSPQNTQIADHLGMKGEKVDRGSFLMISGADRYTIRDKVGTAKDYTPEDISMVQRDPEVQKVYESNLVTWYQYTSSE